MAAQEYELKRKAEADKNAETIRIKADTRLECAEKKTQALLTEMRALEEYGGENIVDMQAHEQRMKYVENIKHLAKDGKIILSNDQGQ